MQAGTSWVCREGVNFSPIVPYYVIIYILRRKCLKHSRSKNVLNSRCKSQKKIFFKKKGFKHEHVNIWTLQRCKPHVLVLNLVYIKP